jgi:hypothetical protein
MVMVRFEPAERSAADRNDFSAIGTARRNTLPVRPVYPGGEASLSKGRGRQDPMAQAVEYRPARE